jgi:hypothetical protein
MIYYRLHKLVFHLEETTDFNVSTERVTIGWGSRVVRYRTRKTLSLFLLRIMKDEECMFRGCLGGGLSLSVFGNNNVFVVILHIITRGTSFRLFSRLRQFKRCYMLPKLDVFRCRFEMKGDCSLCSCWHQQLKLSLQHL